MPPTAEDGERPTRRERVKAAGGWYQYFNMRLAQMAGPAAVGPYDSTPEPARTERPCPLCQQAMSLHTFDRTGPKPIMHCPRSAGTATTPQNI